MTTDTLHHHHGYISDKEKYLNSINVGSKFFFFFLLKSCF